MRFLQTNRAKHQTFNSDSAISYDIKEEGTWRCLFNPPVKLKPDRKFAGWPKDTVTLSSKLKTQKTDHCCNKLC